MKFTKESVSTVETVKAVAHPLTSNRINDLANSIYQELQESGCQVRDIINVSTQLLDKITSDIRRTSDRE